MQVLTYRMLLMEVENEKLCECVSAAPYVCPLCAKTAQASLELERARLLCVTRSAHTQDNKNGSFYLLLVSDSFQTLVWMIETIAVEPLG